MRRVAQALAGCLSLLLLLPALSAQAGGTISLSPGTVYVGYSPTTITVSDSSADFGTSAPPVFLLSGTQALGDVANVTWVSSSELTFTLEPGLASGSYTVEVGGSSLETTLSVESPPTPTFTLSPSSVNAGYSQPVALTATGTGTQFSKQTAVSLLSSSGQVVPGAISAVTAPSTTTLDFDLDTGVPVATYQVSIAGVSGTQTLQVLSGAKLGTTSQQAGYSAPVSMTLQGNSLTSFSSGATVGFENASGTFLATDVVATDAHDLTFDLPANLAPGTYTVTVTASNETLTASPQFTVTAGPSLSISPSVLAVGYTPTTITLTGTGTSFSSKSTLVGLASSSGTNEDAHLGPVQYASGTSASFLLSPNLAQGTYTLTVTVSGMAPLTATLGVGTTSGSGTGSSTGSSSGYGSVGAVPPSATPPAGTVDATAAATETTEGPTTVLTLNTQELAGAIGTAQGQVARVQSSSSDAELVLPAAGVQLLLGEQDQLSLATPSGSYTLPLADLPLARLAAAFGSSSGSDVGIAMQVQPAPSADETVLASAFGNKSVLVPPVSFTLTASANGKTVPVSSLSGRAQSTLTLPAGAEAGPDTVGVMIVQGAPEHAWTHISGSTVTFYSAADPTFAVVSHQTTFSDIQGLPQTAAIQALSDKLVIDGVTSSRFEPQGGVTRAQFAAFLVRGLGLWNVGGSPKFSDVPAAYWATPEIGPAAAADFIQGYPNGKFRPGLQITNEQMAAIVARAMNFLGIANGAATVEPKDAASIPHWAKADVGLVLSQGIMPTNAQGDFSPYAVTTRAQAAQIIWNLMQKAGID